MVTNRMPCVSTVLVAFLLVFRPIGVKSAEFYVSPRGSDKNAGTLSSPFFTLTRARDAVRTLRAASGPPRSPVTIYLRGGLYCLEEPLVLSAEDGGTTDCPVTYAAYRDERPVVSGGRLLSDWKERVTGDKRVWKASIPSNAAGSRFPRSLWIDSQRRVNSRYPNEGYLHVYGVPSLTPHSPWNEGQWAFQYRPGDIPPLGPLAGAEAVVMNRWTESHLPITRIERDSTLLRFGLKTVYCLELGDLYYLINVRESLDQPGEWLADSGSISYLPLKGENPGRVQAVLPQLVHVLLIKGSPQKGEFVDHLIFRGVTFSHTGWLLPDTLAGSSRPVGGFGQAAVGVPAAVEAVGLRYSVFEDCAIKNVGTCGIWLRAGCVGNRISCCEFTDLGAGGIMIGETSIATAEVLRTTRNTIVDCSINDGGKLFHSAVGVWIGQSSGNRLIHNRIFDFYYTGISIGWTWGYGPSAAEGNLVVLNHIHHIGKRSDGDGPILADMGGIYTLGGQPGTLIKRNVFHDINARSYGGWGIYYDEGSTSIVSDENLVYRTSDEGFHQHYGRENAVRNSIFAYGRGHQLARDHAESHTSFAFERNIVYWTDGPMFGGDWAGGEMVFHKNIYWRTDAVPLMADLNFLTQWRATTMDSTSEFRDPAFCYPEKGDFRLAAISPAPSLGIKGPAVQRALDPAPLSGSEESDALRTTPGRRLLFNSDGSNIFMAYDSITARKACERVDAVAGTGVTTFLFCPNPGQNMAYPGKVAPMFHYDRPPESTATWHSWAQRMSDNLASLVRNGHDPVGLVLTRAKLRGMEGFLTFRMNELHDVDKPASPLLSPFWRKHPEYRVGGYAGWGAYALNYAIPEVREYIFAILEELCTRYDLDGLELDFMRFPYYFPNDTGTMRQYADIMTAFVNRVRRMTEARGKERGRPILLSARVPSSLKGCAYVGLDPAAWDRSGLIDFLTVAPFLSTEMDIPVGEFKRVCSQIPVYAALEYTMGSRMMVREETRAASALLLADGADGISLFNYFIPWDEGMGLQPDFEVLPELLSLDSLNGKEKLYTLCRAKYPVPNVSLDAQLPVSLVKGEEHTLTIAVHEGRLPSKVILRVEADRPIAPGDIEVAFNGIQLGGGQTPSTPQVFVHRIPHKLASLNEILEFIVDPTLLRGSNTMKLKALNAVRVDLASLATIFR